MSNNHKVHSHKRFDMSSYVSKLLSLPMTNHGFHITSCFEENYFIIHIMSSNKADALRIFTAFSGVLGSLGLIVTHQIPPESLNNTARGVTYAIAALLHAIFAIYIGKGMIVALYLGLLLGVYTSALIQIFTPEEKIRKD